MNQEVWEWVCQRRRCRWRREIDCLGFVDCRFMFCFHIGRITFNKYTTRQTSQAGVRGGHGERGVYDANTGRKSDASQMNQVSYQYSHRDLHSRDCRHSCAFIVIWKGIGPVATPPRFAFLDRRPCSATVCYSMSKFALRTVLDKIT
jgi:hypothetical protein